MDQTGLTHFAMSISEKAERGLLFTKKKKKERKKERNCEIIFQYEERGLLIAIDYSSMK